MKARHSTSLMLAIWMISVAAPEASAKSAVAGRKTASTESDVFDFGSQGAGSIPALRGRFTRSPEWIRRFLLRSGSSSDPVSYFTTEDGKLLAIAHFKDFRTASDFLPYRDGEAEPQLTSRFRRFAEVSGEKPVILLNVAKTQVTRLTPPQTRSAQAAAGPDCNEARLSEAELDALARGSTSFAEFLGSMKDSMQSYTLVWGSKSRQKRDTDAMNPRVLRYSADARVIIAYTCKPGSSSYGKVEAMFFDETQGRFKMKEYDFKKTPSQRINADTSQCAQCHGTPLRPVWGSYFNWPGVYGHNDDKLVFGDRTEFFAFKKRQLDNPCYSTLPGFTDPKRGSAFPYDDPLLGERNPRYEDRPNTRLSSALSRLNARRVAHWIQSRPYYPRARHLILKSACSHPTSTDLERLSALLGTRMHGNAPLLHQLSGMNASEFTLEKPPYPARGTYNTGDALLEDLTVGVLLELESLKDPELRRLVKLKLTDSEAYGSQFSCIDRNASAIRYEGDALRELCEYLESKHVAENLGSGADSPTLVSAPRSSGGSRVFENRCASCHAANLDRKTVRARAAALKREGADWIRHVEARLLSSSDANRMPPGPDPLSAAERREVLEYFRALLR